MTESRWETLKLATPREVLDEVTKLEQALLDARRFIWLHLLCVDGGAQVIRRIDAALYRPVEEPR